MNASELLSLFDSTYKEEWDKFFIPFEETYKSAIDKKYAVEVFFGYASLAYLFRINADLELQIINAYDHRIKLGGSILDVISAIPEIIDTFKRSEEIKESLEPKRKNKIKMKKFLGLIPYKVESISFFSDGKLGSAFKSLLTLEEIASELGCQRAHLDLFNYFKGRYLEHGGIIDAKTILTDKEASHLSDLKHSLQCNDLNKFFTIFKHLFASLPYNIKIAEGFFHSHIHLVLHLLGCEINSEIETNIGRIDAVVESQNYIHIFEFKKSSSAVALDQIKTKKYYQRFLTSPKTIVLVGVAVDINERNITEWEMHSYK